jgi:hypothetical protein
METPEAESAASGASAAAVESFLEALPLHGATVELAGWHEGLRDFQLDFAGGWSLLFQECLQASYVRPPGAPEPPTVTAWWLDEPSPLLLSLRPEIRHLYSHLVLELGDALLRLAFLRVEAGQRDANDGGRADSPA